MSAITAFPADELNLALTLIRAGSYRPLTRWQGYKLAQARAHLEDVLGELGVRRPMGTTFPVADQQLIAVFTRLRDDGRPVPLIREVAARLGISKQSAHRACQRAYERGVLTRHGDGPRAHYVLAELAP